MEATLFYLLAAVTLVGTGFAITARQTVRAIVYLVNSFFALALIFYLLGAPLIAAFEVIIYAGAIMVLFLFVIMMLDLGHPERMKTPQLGDWLPPALLLLLSAASVAVLALEHRAQPAAGFHGIPIRQFSLALFDRYGVAVELVSLQLLFALVGAIYLGRRR